MSDESRDCLVPVPNYFLDTLVLVPKCPDTSVPACCCRTVFGL